MYERKIVDLGNVIEVSKYFNGRYGKKEKKEKAAPSRMTPAEQLRWQSKEAVRKVWRLLRDPLNFHPGDLWVTLTYPAGSKPESEKVSTDIQNFLQRLRRAYKKAERECKYIYSVGRGKKGGIHLHFVLSKFDTEIISRAWQEIVNNGEWVHTHFEHLDGSQSWKRLADYIVKNGEETFLSDDPIVKKRFCYSRNLHVARPRAKVIYAKEWRRQPAMRKGYYIDKNLSYEGVNQYGYPFQYTVYVRLNTRSDDALRGERRKRL